MAQTPEGAAKIAARYYGLPLEEYKHRLQNQKACKRCKNWKLRECFCKDGSNKKDGLSKLCNTCRQEMQKAQPKKPRHLWKKFGPPKIAPRNGDKRQARASINNEVTWGRFPNPNTIPCTDCGHLGNDHRHEYDHHLGYDVEHHLDVQAVCTPCHSKRGWDRIKQVKIVQPTINTLPLEYRIVPEYPMYRVGNDGSVWSLWKQGGRKAVITDDWRRKSPDVNADGYQRVTLYNQGKKRRSQVHCLVLEVFIGPSPTTHHHGSHLDDNPSNNCLQNLEWATVAANNRKRYKT